MAPEGDLNTEQPGPDLSDARSSRYHFEDLPGFRYLSVGIRGNPRELFFSGERVRSRGGRVHHRAIPTFRLFEALMVCHGVTLPSIAMRQMIADWTNSAPLVLAGDHVRTSGDSRSPSYLALATSTARVLIEVRGRVMWTDRKGLYLDVYRAPTSSETQVVWKTMRLQEPELPARDVLPGA